MRIELAQFPDIDRKAMEAWAAGLDGTGPYGLWVWGERCAGSTALARCAVRLTDRPFARVTAFNLVKELRNLWTLENNTKSDSGLEPWMEYVAAEAHHEEFWSASIPFLDDVRSEIDMTFWVRHFIPRIEEIVKGGRPFVVAGSIPPRTFGPGHETFFRKFFLIHEVTRKP